MIRTGARAICLLVQSGREPASVQLPAARPAHEPVVHDEQHGATAIACWFGAEKPGTNTAARLTGRDYADAGSGGYSPHIEMLDVRDRYALEVHISGLNADPPGI